MVKLTDKIKRVVKSTSLPKKDKLNKQQRKLAVAILRAVFYEQKTLTAVFQEQEAELTKHKAQASFIKAMCFGVLRYYYQLSAIVDHMLEKPLPKKHADIHCLLMLGIYQLIDTDIPAYACVNEAVSTAKQLRKNWATGLTNKLLRRFIDEKEDILAKVNQSSSVKWMHPAWFIDQLRTDWPNEWQDILSKNNEHPPMVIRVNTRQHTRVQYQEILQSQGIESQEIDGLESALHILEPMSATRLPLFSEGACYIQDGAGQYVVDLLDLAPEQLVLDACAAPGSKTTHILEKHTDIKQLTTIDLNAKKLFKITENLKRLQLPHDKVHLVLNDANTTQQWWDGNLYDRILIDAPCSATGVIRRHPDIKVLRTPEDVALLVQQQKRILNSLWPLLAKGGRLLYTTCSILPQENEEVIKSFLTQAQDAKLVTMSLPVGQSKSYGHQILPGQGDHDGFYFCALEKV